MPQKDQELLDAISRVSKSQQRHFEARKQAHKKLLVEFFNALADLRSGTTKPSAEPPRPSSTTPSAPKVM